MLLYISTIFLLGFFAIIDNLISNTQYSKFRTFFYGIAYLLVALQFGLRDKMGTDWDMYESFFKYYFISIQDLDFKNYSVEVAFQILQIGFHYISDNYNLFVLFQSLVFYFVIFFVFYRISSAPFVAIMLFYSLFIGMVGANRQSIALAFCLMGLYYYLKTNNYYIFFGFIVGGFLFHTSALLFSIYLFFNRKIDSKYILIAILCSFIIGNTQLPFKIFSLFGVVSEHAMSKTEAYLDSAKQELERAQVSTFGIAKRIIIPLFFIYFRNKISLKEKYFNVFLNAYVFGTCFYFLFYKTLLVMVSRGGFYFNVFEALLTSSLFFIVDKKYRPIIVFIFIVMSIFYLNQSISPYPEIFIPYRSVFNNLL